MTARKSSRIFTRRRKNTVNHRRGNVAKKEKDVEKKVEKKETINEPATKSVAKKKKVVKKKSSLKASEDKVAVTEEK